MKNNKLEVPSDYQLKESFASIIGIGGGAGRIVNKMQACELPYTKLSVFGMSKKEMEELSLPRLEKILTDIRLSFFIVCLGGGSGEGCIKKFLQKAAEMKIPIKLLVVTLPRSSEGLEKREKALQLIYEIETLTDGIFVVDYDALPCNTISDLYDKADKMVISFVNSFIRMLVMRGINCFDICDVRSFLGYHSNTKFIEFFTLSGSFDYLNAEFSDLMKHLPKKYHSIDDISNIIIAVILNAETGENALIKFMERVVSHNIANKLIDSEVKCAIIDNPDMEKKFFQVDIFTKCN